MMPIPNRDAVALSARTLGALFSYAPNSAENAPLVAAFQDGSWQQQWPFPVAAPLASGFGASAEETLPEAGQRLFIGPWALPAPPWGSVYTDRECVVFGEATLALRAWMRRIGVARTTDERTPEDHIGLMLALLAYLAEERPELTDEYLRDHLLTWAPHYLEALEEAADHPFYQGLAALTRSTLLGLQEARGLEVVTPRFYR